MVDMSLEELKGGINCGKMRVKYMKEEGGKPYIGERNRWELSRTIDIQGDPMAKVRLLKAC